MQFLKKAKFHLQLWDGIWSVPLAFVLFIAFGQLLQWYFTNPNDPQGAPGFYDPSFLQAAFYASAMQVFVNMVVWGGIHFNFRRIKHYHSGQVVEGTVVNKSKDDFEELLPWQRIFVLLFVYSALSVEWIILFVHLR